MNLSNGDLNTPWPLQTHMSLGECEVRNNLYKNCTWLDYDHIKYENSIVQYFRALYWSANIFSTVGYGDIKPITYMETFYDAIWVYIGAMFFYMACGLISAFTEQALAASNKHHDNLEFISIYMNDYKVPLKLNTKIR